MRKFTNKHNFVFIFTIFIVLLFLLIEMNFVAAYSSSPDEVGEKIFYSQIAKNGLLPITDYKNLNKTYKNVFKNRGVINNNQGVMLPIKALGNIYLNGSLFSLLINIMSIEEFLVLMHSIILLIAIIYCYKFVSLLTIKSNYLNLLIITPLLFVFNLYSDRTLNYYTINTLLCLFYFFKWYRKEKTNGIDFNLLLSSLFLSAAIVIRYEFGISILIFSFFLIALIVRKHRPPNILLFNVLPILICILIFFSNKIFYGGILQFGYSFISNATSQAYSEKINLPRRILSLIFIVKLRPEIILRNIWQYVIALFPLIFFPAVISYRTIISNKFITFLIVSISLFLIFYYGSNPTFHGYEDITIESSYARYFAPIYLPLFIYALPVYIFLFERVIRNKIIKFSTLALLTVISMLFVFNAAKADYENNIKYDNSLAQIKKTLPKNAVIFTNYWDKLFYKDYLVATLSNKAKTNQDYFTVMAKFHLDNPPTPVYYIAKDEKEGFDFSLFTRSNKGVKCNNINAFNMCKLE